MTSRREFVKMFGIAFGAAAALLSGRKLLETGDELPSETTPFTFPDHPVVPKGTLWSTSKFDKSVEMVNGDELTLTYKISKPPMILRIAHPNSVWCGTSLAIPGLWFAHGYKSKECTQFGDSMICKRIEFVGVKAMRMRLKEFKYTVMPSEISTDPESNLFKDIASSIDIGPHRGSAIGLYGPVYKVWAVDGAQSIHSHEPFTEYELFCGNRSLRHFAKHELSHAGVPGWCRLGIKKLTRPSMGFEWYVPTLKIKDELCKYSKNEYFARAYGGNDCWDDMV